VHDRLSERIPEQIGATIRARRLPAGQLHRRSRRQRPGRARLGNLHLATVGRRRPPDGLLGRNGGRNAAMYWPRVVPGFRTRADLRERYEKLSGRDLSELDSTSPSPTGSWPASSKGSSARYAGAPAGATPVTTAGWPIRSTGWPGRLPKPPPNSSDRAGPHTGAQVARRLPHPVLVMGLKAGSTRPRPARPPPRPS